MPCLNEAETLASCIRKAQIGIEEAGVKGEIVISDNGSLDGSIDIARSFGARVIQVAKKGYGSALQGGIAAARGRWIVMGDADDSYEIGRASCRERCRTRWSASPLKETDAQSWSVT